MLFDLSKTLLSVGFQKLVWMDHKLHPRHFILFNGTRFELVGNRLVGQLYPLNDENILYTPTSFAPVHFTLSQRRLYRFGSGGFWSPCESAHNSERSAGNGVKSPRGIRAKLNRR